jgi:signal transduction histidine kinase
LGKRFAPDRFILRSLRARFTLAAAVTVVSILAIVWGLLNVVFENHIERLLEDDLQSRLLELAGALTVDESGHPALESEPSDPRYQRPAGGAYWHIDEGGQTVLRSVSLWDFELQPAPRVHLSPRGLASEKRGPNGSTVYLAERDVVLDGAGGPHNIRIAVALDTSAVERLRLSFGSQVIMTLGIIAVMLSVGTWIQASFGLLPLNNIRAQLARVHRGADARMQGRYPSEIEPLVEDLNKLLTQHEELIRRARERAGDLAHGLKTPLTIMRIEARNAEQRGDVRLAATLNEQVDAMNRHVERELKRARMAGASAGSGALVDAHRTVQRLIHIMERMPDGDRLEWRNDLTTGALLRMDPDDFGEIAGNLLDNARKHAQGKVRVSVDMRDGERCICFDDDGPGIPSPDRDRIVARGERAAAASEGSGLGLSIIIEALSGYGLSLHIEDSPLGGCRMAFRELPAFAGHSTRASAAASPKAQ